MTTIDITPATLECIMQRALDALMIDCDESTDAIIDAIESCDHPDPRTFALIDIIDATLDLLDLDPDMMRDRIDLTRSMRP